MDARNTVREIFLTALEACSPVRAVTNAMSVDQNRLQVCGRTINLSDHPIYLLSVGKAAVPMYGSARNILQDYVSGSLVITPDSVDTSTFAADNILLASHPLPDQNSLEAGESALSFVRSVPENGLLLVLLSGGTSSLMCRPPDGIGIGDLRRAYELLNHSGMAIEEINTVRKHCSEVKGGQLLRYLHPDATVGTLAVSDVPHDDISVIGSGPTAAAFSTFEDAFQILKNYNLWKKIPLSVQKHISKGMDGDIEEVPADSNSSNSFSCIISSAKKLSQKIVSLSQSRGLDVYKSSHPFNDDVEQVASDIAKKVRTYIQSEKGYKTVGKLFVFYGESTVEVTGDGKGGRNQELALRGGMKIADLNNVTWLSAGTDGIDGPTDAAGAIVDSSTIPKAERQGNTPQEYLDRNDSYHFHEQMKTHLKTGSTGNNLMDVVLVLVAYN
ncbi:hydroxypyruvate reductase/glycerate 2-kinase [Fodinibius salinus]|uniref:Hydroxypyruvate reductase/glycerate 2-kinase n=1 Tax=Fodinibius salinus TaxID=860790 RepID=A0A5D3YRI5_9BACT|nr:DUF4147 domain-containing protein [Fodinibius salinus]TYP95613.1 hydroxypyruvate reductase/glycerate 2-kinase [Fodinibius salinus]